MISSHPSFRAPTDPEVPLWRYMDLSKFIALLRDRALFFAQSDCLGDPFEGSMPKKNRVELKEALRRDFDPEQTEKRLALLSQTSQELRRGITISCWHASEHESAAMWGLYGRYGDAVCIQTTYNTLALLLPPEIYAGMVTYIDYETGCFDPGNRFNYFMHKRLSFKHEDEFRAILVSAFPPGSAPNLSPPYVICEGGVKVPVDINGLIQKIFVSPASPKWFKGIVESLKEKYDVTAPVKQSSIADDPIY
jgi:hypothetical protein